MTDQITIPRALLEQALNAIQLPCDRWNGVQSKIVKAAADAVQAELAKPDRPIKDSWHFERLDRLLSLCLSEPAYSDYLDSLKRVAGFSAELAKPEPEETFIPDWANYRQGVADGKAGSPKWHDAPTEPGIWLCDEGGPDCYTYTAHNIVLLNDPALKDDECRWYGPIPQDKKGGAP